MRLSFNRSSGAALTTDKERIINTTLSDEVPKSSSQRVSINSLKGEKERKKSVERNNKREEFFVVVL